MCHWRHNASSSAFLAFYVFSVSFCAEWVRKSIWFCIILQSSVSSFFHSHLIKNSTFLNIGSGRNLCIICKYRVRCQIRWFCNVPTFTQCFFITPSNYKLSGVWRPSAPNHHPGHARWHPALHCPRPVRPWAMERERGNRIIYPYRQLSPPRTWQSRRHWNSAGAPLRSHHVWFHLNPLLAWFLGFLSDRNLQQTT